MDYRSFFFNEESRGDRDKNHFPLDRYLNLVGFERWKTKPDDRMKDSIEGICFFMENFGGQEFYVWVSESNFIVECHTYGSRIHSDWKQQLATERGVMLTLAAFGFPNPDMFTSLD